MQSVQMTFDEFLSAITQPVRSSQTRPCHFSASHEAGLRSYHCFGSFRATMNLSGFSPSPRFVIDSFPTLVYYLNHDYLPHDDVVVIFVSYEDKDYSDLPIKYEQRYTVPVRALHEALTNR